MPADRAGRRPPAAAGRLDEVAEATRSSPRSLVNRYWKHFFQRGLIEPEDDIRDSNPPSNPELLAALEKHFIESGFDLKELVRAITRSQRLPVECDARTSTTLGDRQNYSRYYPRRLPAEVLLDAIDQLAGTQTDFANLPPGTRAVALPDNSYNRSSPFLRVFGRPEGAERLRVRAGAVVEPGAEPALDQRAGHARRSWRIPTAGRNGWRRTTGRPKPRSASCTWRRSPASRGPTN